MNLPNILENITGLFKQKGDSFVGIDIGGSSIKIVQAREKGGQAVLETYGELALGPYAEMDIGRSVKLQPDLLVTAVKDILKESNTTTTRCGLAVPITSSLVTTMKVPSISGSNLEEIVTMEARRYIPVSMQEITLDWQVIPNGLTGVADTPSIPKTVHGEPASNISAEVKQKIENSKMLDVLIVAVHTEAIDKLKKLSVKVGLDYRFLELEAFSAIRAVLDGDKKTLAVVDFGAGSTKIYIVENNIIRFSHTISFGSQDITLAVSKSIGVPIAEAERLKLNGGGSNFETALGKLLEGVVSYLAFEVTKITKDYERQNNIPLNSMILTGGGVNVRGLAELFAKKVNVPVTVANPFSKLITPAFLDGLLKKIGPSYSVAVGAALRALEEAN